MLTPLETRRKPPAELNDTFSLVPPEIASAEPGTSPEPLRGEVTGSALKVVRWLGIDRAVGFTILARGWSAMAAAVTIALILRFLSPEEQGFYSVINPLVNVQIIFELGFSFVILQTASHESAHLKIGRDGAITGPAREHGRLSSILQRALRWYSTAAVVLLIFLLAGGRWFFSGAAAHATHTIHWLGPWILAAVGASFTFQVDPIFSFLEGCGFVPQVARARLTQFIAGSLLSIGALATHHGLYAPGMMLIGQACAGGYAIYSYRRLLNNVLRHDPGPHRTAFRTDIWPLQWRMAVSWIAGYLTVPLFTLFLARAPGWGMIEAGRMGVSISIAAKIGDVSMAWMNTKAAPFGRLVALKQFAELDRRFFRALVQSTGLAACGAITVWTLATVLYHHGNHYAARFLSPLGLGLMLFGFVVNTAVSSMAIYLRAHKQEKFMVLSVIAAVYAVPLAWYMGNRFGGVGIAMVYALGSVVIGLAGGTYTFLKWRRIWHSPRTEPAV